MSSLQKNLSESSGVREQSAADTRALIAVAASEVATFFPGPRAERLRTLLPAAEWCDVGGIRSTDWLARVRDVSPEIIVSGWQTPRLPEVLDGLKYVCHLVGSVRGVVPRELLMSGIQVSNWGGIAAPIVAEQALLLILGALRAMPMWETFQAAPHSHVDKDRLETRSLRNRRVSIHGFGQIARELVKLLQPFDVQISSYSAGVPYDLMLDHGVRPVASLEELATDADVLVSCEALTEKTRGSIGREVLSALPRGSVFVNVGRGAVVDETALATVAVERALRVASDVFTHEPLPPDSPLRRISGALYSPHIGGPTLDWYPRCGDQAIENIERYLAGQRPTHEITLEIYDRST